MFGVLLLLLLLLLLLWLLLLWLLLHMKDFSGLRLRLHGLLDCLQLVLGLESGGDKLHHVIR